MQLSSGHTRFAGFAVLAVATVTALSVGACGSSHDEKAPEKSAAASASGTKSEVRGLITSVSGDTVEVAESAGTATVKVGSSTRIIEDSGAELSEIVAGSCVRVAYTTQSGAAPGTADGLRLTTPAGDGKCAQPKTTAVNVPKERLNGTVLSVQGNVLNVAFTDAAGNPAETQVTVYDKTVYRKDTVVPAQAIENNKCIIAQVTKGDGGPPQAKTVSLSATNKEGKCPAPAAKTKK